MCPHLTDVETDSQHRRGLSQVLGQGGRHTSVLPPAACPQWPPGCVGSSKLTTLKETGCLHAYPEFVISLDKYAQASPGAQIVKNPPAMQEIWAQSLCREDPLETGMATHSSMLAWRISWTEGHEESGMTEATSQQKEAST